MREHDDPSGRRERAERHGELPVSVPADADQRALRQLPGRRIEGSKALKVKRYKKITIVSDNALGQRVAAGVMSGRRADAGALDPTSIFDGLRACDGSSRSVDYHPDEKVHPLEYLAPG